MSEDLSYFIKGMLKTRVMGREIISIDETDSTNQDAMKLAQKGGQEGWVVVARRQRRGKGRRGKQWSSPGGQNLYMSVLLRPRISLRKTSFLTLLATVAVAETLSDYIAKGVFIKWPNDVMVTGKKISGILLEMGKDVNGEDFLVLGVGINVNCTRYEIPPELSEIATSLYLEIGYSVSVKDVLFKLLNRLDYGYCLYTSSDFDAIIERFRAFEQTTGRRVLIDVAGARISGHAVGIDEDGFLLVQDDDGKISKVISGDLQFE
ncbi:MAG: biotin--[acetyl-CoA-carboxylase] ligase [Deltaproteobacteria bacterium]|nr:biotin--[acetyl-CoA-carboxylase] ligase [Candidatus Zymogenaceae bacterium]